jgi:putative sterol carrier protein
MDQQQQTSTSPEPRAVARRIPGLEGISARVRVEVKGGRVRMFAIRDGAVEPAEEDGQPDTTIVFDDEGCVEELMSGRLNPIVAALRGSLRVAGDLTLAARVLFEVQGQATAFGRNTMAEA